MKQFILLLLMMISLSSYSQNKDLIIFKSGDEINCTIMDMYDATTTYNVSGQINYIQSHTILAYKLRPNSKAKVNLTRQDLPIPLIETFNKHLAKSEKEGRIGGILFGVGFVSLLYTGLSWGTTQNEKYIWLGTSIACLPIGMHFMLHSSKLFKKAVATKVELYELK